MEVFVIRVALLEPVLRFSALATERWDRPLALPTEVLFFLTALAGRETFFGFGEALRDLLVFTGFKFVERSAVRQSGCLRFKPKLNPDQPWGKNGHAID